jgi:hypothetical protein
MAISFSCSVKTDVLNYGLVATNINGNIIKELFGKGDFLRPDKVGATEIVEPNI